MRWFRLVLGLLVLGAFGYGVYAWRSGTLAVPGLPAAQPPALLKAGTPIALLTLQELTSGGSQEGDEVTLVVTEDVKDHMGRTLIPRGALAKGVVTHSRAAHLASAIVRQPARLEVRLMDVETVDRGKAHLCSDVADPAEGYDFTRANVSGGADGSLLRSIWQDPETRQILTDLANGTVGNEEARKRLSEDANASLGKIAEKLGLEKAQEWLESRDRKSGNKLDVGSAIESLRKGDYQSLPSDDLILAAQAIGELVDLATNVDRQLRGMLKGPNIKAKVGTPIKAFVAEDVKVYPG